jgi:hypothetical protein
MDTSDAIALAALFVSAFAVAYTVWANRHQRRAKIMASEAKPHSRNFTVMFGSWRYAVELHNAGRAIAQAIAAELLDAQEGQLQEPTKIALLGSGETEHVEFEVDEKAPRAVALRVEWRDEAGLHSERFALEREPER